MNTLEITAIKRALFCFVTIGQTFHTIVEFISQELTEIFPNVLPSSHPGSDEPGSFPQCIQMHAKNTGTKIMKDWN